MSQFCPIFHKNKRKLIPAPDRLVEVRNGASTERA